MGEIKIDKSEKASKEEQILEFWRKNKIFEKSLQKNAPEGNYVFYDGPPFATGLPHYGHILGSVTKDVIGRYKTMRGYSVPRRWGWDCHGLPIENIVEKDLGISGKKGIEGLGVDKFVEYARSKVLTYVAEWEKTIDRIGRWVDFKNSYKTMDNTFIESVWWALEELNKKALLYEGVRVLAYCPRCETPIANSEIAMDNSYKDITDISVYVKAKVSNEPDTYLLGWTTTPWTLPGNTAIAVNKNITYAYVSHDVEKGKESIIIAKDNFEQLKDKFNNPKILKEVKGEDLVGLSYEPFFDYYRDTEMPNKKNIWKVWHADFVTLDKGTGIAHEAPAFGEEDMGLAKKRSIPFIRHVEPDGVFSKEVKDFVGIKVKPKEDNQATDILIIKHLAKNGLLFAKEKIIHSYPHCYRCETPLLYYALPSWFVNIQKAKKDLLQTGESINWVPSHLKDGRFKNTVESAPDWTISRNRYWASPLPIWKSTSGKMIQIGSLEELKSKTKRSGNKYFIMRHGGAESNLKGLISSKVEDVDHLTEKGKDQVLNSLKGLEDKKIDLIISSDFMRTRETAEIVKEKLGLKDGNIILDNRLRELCAGIYDGKNWVEYWASCEDDHYFYKAEGGESYADVKIRVASFIYDIEKKYKNKNILIVTHEDPARMIMAGTLGLSNEEVVKKLQNEIMYFKNAEIVEFEFVPIPHDKNYELDLHRPYIDEIILVDEEGEEYKRISEVIDCWFESGSMPFAQDHFPFENKDWKSKNFPSGFVAEYIAQTRTWFYYTHVISAILFKQAPFENVVTTGTVLAEDGQKMSKSRNNFPDPWILFDKYGVDALRFYLMSCPVMKGEDLNFSEKSVQDISSKIINRLGNVMQFYELYRDKEAEDDRYYGKGSELNEWIILRFEDLLFQVTKGMEEYDLALAAKPLESFIEDLSVWYLRRSRELIKNGDKKTKATLFYILVNLAKILAPFTPFMSEDIWQRLERNGESVHLSEWPRSQSWLVSLFKKRSKKIVLDNMREVRRIVTLGLEARQKSGIKVRQPLSSLKVKAVKLSDEYIELIKDELNVRDIIADENIEGEVLLDTNITKELKEEGNYRELVRAIQDMRKNLGLTPSDKVELLIETSEEGKRLVQKFEEDLSNTVLAFRIEFSKNEGQEIKIENLFFKILIENRENR